MALEIWWTGKQRQDSYEALSDEYKKRLTRYGKVKFKVFKDSKNKDIDSRKEEESEAILKSLGPTDHCVLLDEHGENITTLKLVKKLENKWLRSKRCVIIIGGAFGVSNALKVRADEVLALSQLTLPHQMAKTLLLEQLYRCFTVMNNENYHHE